MARPGLSDLANPEIIAMVQTLLDELARKAARAQHAQHSQQKPRQS
jgi:hypothetical protein